MSAPPTSGAPRPVSALLPDVRKTPDAVWFRSGCVLLASIEFDTTPTALVPAMLKPFKPLSNADDSYSENRIVPRSFEFAE